MNKLLKYLAAASLIILSLSEIASAEFKIVPLSPAYVKAEQTMKKGSTSRDYGYIPSPINWEYLDKSSETKKSSPTLREAAPLPDSYDNRAKMTPARDQMIDGPCWAHAAATAAGASLIEQGILAPATKASELSEWYLVYYAFNFFKNLPSFYSSNPSFYSNGGNDWIAVALFSKGAGAVLLSDAPTPSADMRETYVPPVMDRKFRLTDAHHLGFKGQQEISVKLNNTFNIVKKAIMENGAVSAGINWQNGCTENTTSAYYSDDSYSGLTNHGITLVGWDDNYPVENFMTHKRPSAPGAWIIKNSWGESAGDNGYYYVSYEEESLCDGVAYVMEKAPENETIYQYDPLGCLTFLETDNWNEQVHTANMFVAKSNANQIDSVAFYTALREQTADITIYTGCTTAPNTGTKVLTQKVTLPKQGYNTVKLTSPVKLTPGENFSIIITYYSTSGENIFVPVEGKDGKLYRNASSKPKQSWLAKGNEPLTDLYGLSISGITEMNCCIKAIDSTAKDTGENPTPHPSPHPSEENGGGGCNTGMAGLFALAFMPFAIRKRK